VTRFDPKHPSRIVLRLVPFIIEATSADVQVWAMMERMLAAPRRRPRATRSRLLDCRSRRRPSRVQIPGRSGSCRSLRRRRLWQRRMLVLASDVSLWAAWWSSRRTSCCATRLRSLSSAWSCRLAPTWNGWKLT